MLDNPRWERFVQAYAVDGNAVAAYKAAGYKTKTDAAASACAYKLLRNAVIQKRLAELTAEARSRAEQSAIADMTEIRQRVTAILRGDVDGLPTSKSDMLKAADLLAKWSGQIEQPTVKVELSMEAKQARLRELLNDAANRR